jgi:predicted alpha/beta superfamily hydrolase
MAARPISPVTLAGTELHRLRASGIDQEFELRVALPVPGLMRPLPDRYDTLYVLDGDLFFGTAVEMTRLMSMLFGELPPLLVVGIGYGGNDPKRQGQLRNRDFTPTTPREMPGMREPPGWTPILPEEERFGHADRFLAFLRDQVRPFIAARYPVTGSTSLYGSSMGGLFATWALLTEPGLFDRYLVASPALWWDNEVLFGLEQRQAEAAIPLSGKVFFGVGAQEEAASIPMLAQFRMITNVRAMAERLAARGHPALEVHHQVFEGESHTSVVPVVLTRALRTLYRRAG